MKILNCAVQTLKLTCLAAAFGAVLAAPAHAQIAPEGGIFIQQPAGVYYIFGGNGTQSGGAFYYLNYSTQEFDIITPTIQANGSFSGFSPITNRSINGQIFATSITLTYNGATVSSPKLPTYGPTKARSGGYLGSWVDNSGNVGVTTLAIFPKWVGCRYFVQFVWCHCRCRKHRSFWGRLDNYAFGRGHYYEFFSS